MAQRQASSLGKDVSREVYIAICTLAAADTKRAIASREQRIRDGIVDGVRVGIAGYPNVNASDNVNFDISCTNILYLLIRESAHLTEWKVSFKTPRSLLMYLNIPTWGTATLSKADGFRGADCDTGHPGIGKKTQQNVILMPVLSESNQGI